MGEDGGGNVGLNENIWDNGKTPVVASGPGTISMDHITVVCANLPSDHLLGLL